VTRDAIRDRNMPNGKQLERWLLSEDTGQDDAAEAEFAHLFTALPRVEPGADFIQRTVTEVWRVRARRRRILALGWAATIILVVGGAVMAYFASPRLATSVIKALAFATGRSVPWWLRIRRSRWTGGGPSPASAVRWPPRLLRRRAWSRCSASSWLEYSRFSRCSGSPAPNAWEMHTYEGSR